MSLEPLREPTDAELVRRSSTGDEDAFRVLFDRKHRRVFLIAYQMLGDAAAAEDVVQEAFLALWSHAGRYRPRFRVDAWLTRITTNTAIDRYRSERRHPRAAASLSQAAVGEGNAHDEVSPEDGLVAGGEAGDATSRARWGEIQDLWDALSEELPPQQRAAFVLREIERLPSREVAAALGCSVSTVRSHVALARRHLRDALARSGRGAS